MLAAQEASFGPAAPAPTAVSREQVLQVRRVNIASPFDGSSLVYRTRGGTYVKDYYSEWVAPPEELLSTALVDWLSSSGPFAAAVDGRSAAPHRFALETSITSLYGDFQDPRNPRAVLDARVYLLDDAGINRNVAYQNQYRISVPLDGASAQQLVLGAGDAYRQLLESIARDLSAQRETGVATNTRKFSRGVLDGER
jgi:cholesterol transport system auxiliary component